jgi:hypothetical protein
MTASFNVLQPSFLCQMLLFYYPIVLVQYRRVFLYKLVFYDTKSRLELAFVRHPLGPLPVQNSQLVFELVCARADVRNAMYPFPKILCRDHAALLVAVAFSQHHQTSASGQLYQSFDLFPFFRNAFLAITTRLLKLFLARYTHKRD